MNRANKRTNFVACDEGFNCLNCQKKVIPLGRGYRNHCPFCLYSRHVDENVPGDRLSLCRGLMKPIALEAGSRKGYLGYSVLHQCLSCGKQIRNLATDEDRLSEFLTKQHKKS
ncbi:MAG: hypothetical protein UT55_C0068G0013 [Candidatus Peregrinibacteria bacterium GW2011_GWE2_39_6]|nr:MAG: hypothetical protein UT36_C0006G0055 [Candidatus Peregrinibacteria bacterium GW2011_GWF2_39_17]KKR24232.1 MAG: hypothetical protein UT55_C0068G0013 [Candidatus Peregrinibacteria bacterium GW2011_GWE2_39_6]HCW32783.1 hypothetical protein [Candidatus Peregrinibacteria bacterium]